MSVILYVRGSEPGAPRQPDLKPVRCMNNTAWVFAEGGGARITTNILRQFADEWLELEESGKIVACADERSRPVISLKEMLRPTPAAPVVVDRAAEAAAKKAAEEAALAESEKKLAELAAAEAETLAKANEEARLAAEEAELQRLMAEEAEAGKTEPPADDDATPVEDVIAPAPAPQHKKKK